MTSSLCTVCFLFMWGHLMELSLCMFVPIYLLTPVHADDLPQPLRIEANRRQVFGPCPQPLPAHHHLHIPWLNGHSFEENCNQLEFLPRREMGLYMKQHTSLQKCMSGSKRHLPIHITQQGSELPRLTHLRAQVCLECWEGACLISTPR